MKDFRNRVYTLYKSSEVELSQNDDFSFHLISRNGVKPDNDFRLYEFGEGIYTKDVNSSEITNAFSVETYASYKGIIWQVDRQNAELLRLSTSTDPQLPQVKMIGRGWYEIWVDKKEIDRIWEERKASSLPIPFPSQISPIKEITLD